MLTKLEESLLDKLRKTARQRVKDGYEFKEFTGIIGELAACQWFKGYKWTPSDGYDATDENCNRIQIKTRKVWTSPNFTSGTINKFGRKDKYEFEIGILVLLDKKFEIAEIWQLDKDEIRNRESRENGRLLALKVSAFIRKPVTQYIHPNFRSLRNKEKL